MGHEHVSSVFLQQMNQALWPNILFSLRPSRLPGRKPLVRYSLLQTFPPWVAETIQECARAPGFQDFCRGLHWNNNLMIRVSEDRSQAEGRWPRGLARQRTAQKTSKQTVMDRWASHGCRGPRVAVRWKAAAEESDWHLGTKDEADAWLCRPAIMSASLDLDLKTDQLFQQELLRHAWSLLWNVFTQLMGQHPV